MQCEGSFVFLDNICWKFVQNILHSRYHGSNNLMVYFYLKRILSEEGLWQYI